MSAPLFNVLKSVPFFWEWSQGFRDEAVLEGSDGDFACFCYEEAALNPYDIPNVQFFEVCIGFFAELIAGDVDLDLACSVLDFEESGFSHDSKDHDSTGYRDDRPRVLAFLVEA